jgi:hypothetical protein
MGEHGVPVIVHLRLELSLTLKGAYSASLTSASESTA